jgi:hypothetical protein
MIMHQRTMQALLAAKDNEELSCEQDEEYEEWMEDSDLDDGRSDVSIAIKGISEFIEDDATQNKKDDAVLHEMMGKVTEEKCSTMRECTSYDTTSELGASPGTAWSFST